MAAEDYFDPYGGPEDDEDTALRCRSCGELCQWESYWEHGKRHWYLIGDNGMRHICGTSRATADEFDG